MWREEKQTKGREEQEVRGEVELVEQQQQNIIANITVPEEGELLNECPQEGSNSSSCCELKTSLILDTRHGFRVRESDGLTKCRQMSTAFI